LGFWGFGVFPKTPKPQPINLIRLIIKIEMNKSSSPSIRPALKTS
jgi:hypothetical protein